MVILEIDCKLCMNENKCWWRWQTDAMRYQDCDDYEPKVISDIKTEYNDNNREIHGRGDDHEDQAE